MKSFHQVQSSDLTAQILQEELSSRGYVLIRQLFFHADVTNLLDDITQILSAARLAAAWS